MRKQVWMALAAAFLLAGIPAVPAVRVAAPAAGIWHSPLHWSASRPASDVLLLTRTQQKIAWEDLHRRLHDQYGPPNFSTMVGWWLPDAIAVRPVTRAARRDVPALRPYDFAMVQGTLLIVNPADMTVAEVIRGRSNWR